MKDNVLIIDTDLENCKQIKYNLLDSNTEVYYVHTVSEAMQMIQANSYTLIIMDVLLSQDGGVDVLRMVKQISDGALLVLSEQASSAERVLALQCGADDVLNKPFDMEECLARAQKLIRHDAATNKIIGRSYAVVGNEDLILDTARRRVSIAGRNITLKRKEYDILLYLLTHRKQVLTYEQIYTAVWKEEYLNDNSVVFFQVNQLRKKLGEEWIENVYGVGYRLRDFIVG